MNNENIKLDIYRDVEEQIRDIALKIIMRSLVVPSEDEKMCLTNYLNEVINKTKIEKIEDKYTNDLIDKISNDYINEPDIDSRQKEQIFKVIGKHLTLNELLEKFPPRG